MLKTDSKKLETRDFISVGIFSLIYAVVAFVIGGVAQMTPVTFPFMPMIVALFTGTVFMLYVAKIPKKGALSILGVIAAILLFITGMFWMMSVFFLVFGVIAVLSALLLISDPLRKTCLPTASWRLRRWGRIFQWLSCPHSLMLL